MKLSRITPELAQNWPSRKRAHFFNTLSGFKPVQLMGTANSKGQHNLAMFSQVFHIGASPPLLGVLFRPATVPRHSLSNLEETGFFTLNHVAKQFVNEAHQTAAKYEEGESEFNAVGLTPVLSEMHTAPYVAEAPVQIGLKFKEKQLIQANQTILVVGEIVEVFYPEVALKEDGYLDLSSLDVTCCTGMDAYHTTQKMQRMAYAVANETPHKLPKELF